MFFTERQVVLCKNMERIILLSLLFEEGKGGDRNPGPKVSLPSHKRSEAFATKCYPLLFP